MVVFIKFVTQKPFVGFVSNDAIFFLEISIQKDIVYYVNSKNFERFLAFVTIIINKLILQTIRFFNELWHTVIISVGISISHLRHS